MNLQLTNYLFFDDTQTEEGFWDIDVEYTVWKGVFYMPDNQSCIFCKIINGDIPSKKVYEDNSIIAFHDISPNAPVHVLVIPKEHIPSLNSISGDHSKILSEIMMLIPKLAKELGVYESGYRVIVNCGNDSGMMVEHLHFHILGGRPLPQKLS